MSTVVKLDCFICNPEAGDVKGIRRPVTVTSEELAKLILHVVTEHTPKPVVEFAPTQASKTLDEVAPVVAPVSVAPVDLGQHVVNGILTPLAQPPYEDEHGKTWLHNPKTGQWDIPVTE